MSGSRGSVFKRGNGWAYRFSYRDNTGKRRYKMAQGFDTKQLAEKYLTQALSAIDQGKGLNAHKVPLADYLRFWCEQYERAGRVKPSTVAASRSHIDAYIVPMLCGDPERPILLSKLNREMIKKFYGDLYANGRRGVNGEPGASLSAKTVRNIAGTLHKSLSDAVKDNYLSNNPADAIDLPRWDRRDLNVWDAHQFAHFLQVAIEHDDPMYPLWRLVIATGIRRGELLGLRWRDVDLVEGFVSINQTRITDGTSMKIGTPKTRAGRRTIAIDNGTVTALWHLKTLHNTAAEMLGMPLSDLVAADVDGKPISRHTLMDRFHAATERAGLTKCRLHDLRHSAAADALERGVPVHIVAGRLGHANPSVTLNVYAAFLPRADRDAATTGGSLLDELMTKSKTRTERAPRAERAPKNRHSTTPNDTRQLIKLNEINDATNSAHSHLVGRQGIEPIAPPRKHRKRKQ